MEKVTILLEEEVVYWAKAWAAKHDTSLSRMLADELKKKMFSEETYERAMQRYCSKQPKILNAEGGNYPSRDSLYER